MVAYRQPVVHRDDPFGHVHDHCRVWMVVAGHPLLRVIGFDYGYPDVMVEFQPKTHPSSVDALTAEYPDAVDEASGDLVELRDCWVAVNLSQSSRAVAAMVDQHQGAYAKIAAD